MGEELYEVYNPETGTVYAQRMTLEIAAVLTEALFRLWYSEPILRISRMQFPKEGNQNGRLDTD